MNASNYIFIVSPRRSGSTLLMSLLDGHPQLSVWPGEMMYYLHTEIDRSGFFANATMSMQKITDNLLEPLTIAFREYGRDLNDEKVDWKSYIRFCLDCFKFHVGNIRYYCLFTSNRGGVDFTLDFYSRLSVICSSICRFFVKP